MPSPPSDCALLILAHGSTENPDSSQPSWELADALQTSGPFSKVYCAFWKEEPSFRQVWSMIEEREVYAVPNFISEGYFTRQVLPRELGLDGPTTEVGEHLVHYCDPVGIHPTMTKLLVQRARDLLPGDLTLSEVSLIIVGHGTNLNKQSTEAIKAQVAAISAWEEAGESFGEVLDAYMEEAPFVADWATLTRFPTVVVVPFFIADGLHSYQDIPVLLGLETNPTAAASQQEVFRRNPTSLQGRTVYYSSAIGTDPAMATVILDQVMAFNTTHLS
jgi:sirohydrochlorin cobaltochelatase